MKNYQLIFSLESREDLINIHNYIFEDSQNFIIADDFVRALYQTLESSLPCFPHKHPVYNNSIRKFIFSKHVNYTAYFEIDEEKDHVVVLAITDSKQFTRYMKF